MIENHRPIVGGVESIESDPFDLTYGRTGTLWEGRYKAALIDSDTYVLTCYRYIELNPVRAAMVNHPREYLWSSYRHNALGEEDNLVVSHSLYKALGKTDEQRQRAYRALFRARIPNRTLEEIRAATNKAWVLGCEPFKDKIQVKLNRPVRPRPRGGDRKSQAYRRRRGINRV